MICRALLFAIIVLTGCSVKRAIPTSEVEGIYAVTKGDTIERIAALTGVSAPELVSYNQLSNPKSLKIGQIIKIPAIGPIDVEGQNGTQELLTPVKRDSVARKMDIAHVSKYIGALAFPMHGALHTSPFGWRGGRFHEGTDFAAPHGTPIYAAHDGVVVMESRSHGKYGHIIALQGEDLLTVYGHNSSNLVSVGDRVRKGDQIGEVGATGRATGPHLHFETRVRNADGRYAAVNPYLFFIQLRPRR